MRSPVILDEEMKVLISERLQDHTIRKHLIEVTSLVNCNSVKK